MVTLPISSNLRVGCDRAVLCPFTIRHNYGGPGSHYQDPSAHQGPPEHLFLSCSLAQQGIAWVRPFYHLASPQAPVINSRIMLFGFTRDELLCVPRAFTYIINALKYLILRHRNDFRFRGVIPSHLRLIAQLRARVSFFLYCYSNASVHQGSNAYS